MCVLSEGENGVMSLIHRNVKALLYKILLESIDSGYCTYKDEKIILIKVV